MYEGSEANPAHFPVLLRREQIREIFGISDRTVTRWITEGTLNVIEVTGTQRFHPDDVRSLFQARFRRRHRLQAVSLK